MLCLLIKYVVSRRSDVAAVVVVVLGLVSPPVHRYRIINLMHPSYVDPLVI